MLRAPVKAPRIIFATTRDRDGYQPSDALIADALNGAGARCEPAPWDGPFAPFAKADCVLVRSTWGYARHVGAFRHWLTLLEEAQRPVLNPVALMRWNLSKRYLRELILRGVPTPPTRFVAPSPLDIGSAMDALVVETAIVKPVYSASALGLSIVNRAHDGELRDAAERLGGAGIVQPVVEEIKRSGETSLVFIDGAFSHAVLKRPGHGEFRVQSEFGGSVGAYDPSEAAVSIAAKVVAMAPERPLYARVDAILNEGRFTLMEVELIEPELFYTEAPAAVGRFAEALLKRLRLG
ncbi:MAG: hypothetical protein AAF850_02185 [Pseudomonadota bacterium]